MSSHDKCLVDEKKGNRRVRVVVCMFAGSVLSKPCQQDIPSSGMTLNDGFLYPRDETQRHFKPLVPPDLRLKNAILDALFEATQISVCLSQ